MMTKPDVLLGKMVRHILLIKLKPGTSEEQVDALRDALAGIQFERRRNHVFAHDLGLREGNADIAIMADFDNEDDYNEWSEFPPHDRVRKELLEPIAERRERCQIEI